MNMVNLRDAPPLPKTLWSSQTELHLRAKFFRIIQWMQKTEIIPYKDRVTGGPTRYLPAPRKT